MKIAPARSAAFEILLQIELGTAHSSALLPIYEETLGPEDRGLCHELVLGVLRKQIMLDRQIDALTGARKIDIEVRLILRLALYQLSFLDRVPDHAAVNDAVNLAVKAKKTSAKGFVNAILRKFRKEPPELAYADELDRLSVETSHPRWLLERWIGEFGEGVAGQFARFNNETPDVEFRWTLKSTDAVRTSLERPDVPNRSEYLRELAANGKIYFQERGSQFVAGAVQLNDGERFLDVCAAPGGKTTPVALNSKGKRVQIAAGDLSAKRIATLAENCRNQGAGFVDIVRFDAAAALPFADGAFDVVLVDAPCSGTGTIRHNPEIRYLINATEISALAAKQLAIMESASKVVKSDGRLVYSTCSMEREENEAVCGEFEMRNTDFERVAPDVPEEFITAEGYARTFPVRDRIDGFFVAMFRKK
ncbi:MAG: 16S rRNA (cytosine(967)-C(5))-methyltransferase RsmB [Acidobacteria bacterium]|nr:16S rRNA (cytosine(967)-C(5))-methyltransferase RsmB [Acidobacteriota bacterium]